MTGVGEEWKPASGIPGGGFVHCRECKAGTMTIPVLAFFNNYGGVGQTTLAYHVAWKLSDLGVRTLACDLDPQSNLTAAFLSDEEMEELWESDQSTIYRSIEPLLPVAGDLDVPKAMKRADSLY